MPNDVSPVTKEHALHFGFIINLFAKIEHNMQITAAGILNTDLGTTMILMGEMQYRQKRQTLNHLNTTIGIDGHISGELKEILDRVNSEADLRNNIAHAVWVAGRRPGAIKPMRLMLRGKVPEPLGHDDDERDYRPEDLKAAARRLAALDERLVKLLDSSGLMARVAAKIEAIKASMAESPGNPSSK